MDARNFHNQPKICLVSEFFYPDCTGGTGTVLSDLTATLRQCYPDMEIEVVTSRNLYRDASVVLPKSDVWNGVNIHRIKTPHASGGSTAFRLLVNAWFGLLALLSLLKRPRYDLIVVGTAPPTLAMTAMVYKFLTGTPYVYIVYDLDPDRAITIGVLNPTSVIAKVLGAAQKRWLHAAAKTVVLGRCMQKHLQATYKVKPEQVEVIAIGANPDEITPGSKLTRFREDNGFRDFLVVYSGNFGRYHNFDTILDAAKSIASKRSDVKFVLVGDGAQKARIEGRIEDENITNVHLFPFVAKEDYSDLLASADVSLVTLEPGMEGLCVPSKLYSILASGRPVIALVAPSSEVGMVVEESRCGVQVGHGDVHRFVSVILDLVGADEDLARMGANARATLEAKYSTTRVADQYYQVMMSAAGFPIREVSEVYSLGSSNPLGSCDPQPKSHALYVQNAVSSEAPKAAK